MEANLNYNIDHNDSSSGLPWKVWRNVYNSVKDGFCYNLPDLRIIEDEDIETIISKAKKFFGEPKFYDYSLRDEKHFRYTFETVRFEFSNAQELALEISAKNEDDLYTAWKIFKEVFENRKDKLRVSLNHFYVDFGQITSFLSDIEEKDIGAEPKYTPYIDIDEMFSQFFKGRENILMFVGPSGLGKSKLSSLAIKYMFEHPEEFDKSGYEEVVTVKSTQVLASDEFWHNLQVIKPRLVIIDDLDFMLGARDEEITSGHDVQKNAFMNQFLSFSDGIIKSNTKFIITTNQDIDDIDSALLRKGRLFEIIQLRPLTKDECEKIFKEECPDKPVPEFKDETLASDLAYIINSSKVVVKDYLKEKLQTRVLKIKKKKKISLGL